LTTGGGGFGGGNSPKKWVSAKKDRGLEKQDNGPGSDTALEEKKEGKKRRLKREVAGQKRSVKENEAKRNKRRPLFDVRQGEKVILRKRKIWGPSPRDEGREIITGV